MGAGLSLKTSAALYEQAKSFLPGGSTRATLFRKPHPFYVSHGEGAYIWDADGNRYLDLANNFMSLIHGHANPRIIEAVSAQLARGTCFSMSTESEIAMSAALQARAPSFERICFANTGTEAVLFALKAARAYTGRTLVAKVEGCYHGLSDFAEVSVAPEPDAWGETAPASVPYSIGAPQAVLDNVVVLPFNDLEKALSVLNGVGDRLACVLVDPVPSRAGLAPAQADYLQGLRDFCTRSGALLIFDQVMSFRLAYGGVEEYFGVTPDLSCLGKIIGGGFPIGALAGRVDVMDVFNPESGRPKVFFGGTFAANPISMTAGLVALDLYGRQEVAHTNALGDRLRDEMNEWMRASGIEACVTGAGSLFKFHLGRSEVRDYRSAWVDVAQRKVTADFVDALATRGFHIIPSGLGCLSTAVTPEDIDAMIEASKEALRAMH
jgi:glutamate-1-semialdehyde 2,1-aminomutase